MRNRTRVIVIIVMLLVLVSIFIYKKSNTPVPTPIEQSTEQAEKDVPISINKEDIREENFSGTAPAITGSSVLAIEAKNYIRETISNFANSANTEVPDMRAKFGADSPTANYSIDIDAKYVKGTKTESIVINQYAYTGGANGNSVYKVFTASSGSGDILQLKDVLKPGKEVAFVEALKKRLLSWRPEGATQSVVFENSVADLKIENLTNWSLDDANLTIYFDKYAIGPGVLGPVAFTLPIYTLNDFLLYN